MAILSKSGTPKVVLCIFENAQVCRVPHCLEEISGLGPASGGQLPQLRSVKYGWFNGKSIQKPES